MTVTVLSGPERRRRWTSAEKLRIVEESLAPAAIASEVARCHDVHPNQLYTWRRQARVGLLTAGVAATAADGCRFVPVAVVAKVSEGKLSAKAAVGVGSSATIEVALRNGRVLRLREAIGLERAVALADALDRP
jgi:transposase